jgi:hypothetical protein
MFEMNLKEVALPSGGALICPHPPHHGMSFDPHNDLRSGDLFPTDWHWLRHGLLVPWQVAIVP